MDKLTVAELVLIKMALEEALEDWEAQERGLETAKILFPDDYHILYADDELPSEALDLAEMLLIKVSEELRLRERVGETVWWKEEETVSERTVKTSRHEVYRNSDEEGGHNESCALC